MDSLKKLKILRAKVKWEIKDERIEFHRQLVCLIENWKGQLPDFREIFQSEEIDWLLTKSIDSMGRVEFLVPPFIEFLINIGYKDEPTVDQDGKPLLLRTTPVHRVVYYRIYRWVPLVARKLFDIYDRLDVNYIDKESGLSHFHVACRFDFDDIVQKFLELGQDPNLVVQERGLPPLHSAVTHDSKKVVELLLRNGANPNLIDLYGRTPLHVICSRSKNQFDDECLLQLFFKINDENHQIVQVDAWDKDGNTPLRMAVNRGKKKTVEFLIRKGADPNLADNNGRTLMHNICDNFFGGPALAKMLFEICDKIHQTVQLGTRDKWGNTPLHLPLGCKAICPLMKLLLRRGLSLNLVITQGTTPLHVICEKNCSLAEKLFRIYDEMQQVVDVNARDDYGKTPLHVVFQFDANFRMNMVELLLTRGADPNVADLKGLTPLHVICQREDKWETKDEDLLNKFLEMCDEKNLTLQLDARDELNLTPLQLAVGNLLPNIVNILLDRGADLSSFAFPTENYFAEGLKVREYECPLDFKWRMTSDVLVIVEHLENRGYELKRSDALMIMKSFAKIEVLEKTSDLEKFWYNDEKFVETSKKILMKKNNPGLSLYYLIRLRPREAAKRLTRQDWFKFAHANRLRRLPEGPREACVSQMCEIQMRSFLRPWILDPFLELTRYRLPILCCDMILDRLMSQDLCQICLAAAGQSY